MQARLIEPKLAQFPLDHCVKVRHVARGEVGQIVPLDESVEILVGVELRAVGRKELQRQPREGGLEAADRIALVVAAPVVDEDHRPTDAAQGHAQEAGVGLVVDEGVRAEAGGGVLNP